jgi:CDGSH-type Zn-finger protein
MSRRERATSSEAPQVRLYPDGPMLVRGRVSVVDQDGIERCSRRNVTAICRCGRSRIAPLCDGSHQVKVRTARTD